MSQTSYTYDGTTKKPTVTVKDGTKALVSGNDYTVTYPSDCISTGNKTLTVTGKANYFGTIQKAYIIKPKPATRNPFVWGRDNWNFINSDDSYFANYGFKGGTNRDHISTSYLNKLISQASNKESQKINTMLDKEWQGSCFGMTSVIVLANNGLLPYSNYSSGALNTYSLDKPLNNSNVDSLITYYLLSQKLDYAMQRFDYYYTTENGKPELQIKRIIAEIDNYGMANICDKNHSLLAYDYGYGAWRWNGVTYGGCIYLCDPNCSDHFDETYCLYFNTNSYNWVIPHYGTKKSSVNGDYIDFVVGDPDILNTCGYLSGNSKSSIEQYYGNLTANLVAENHSVSKMVKGDKGYSKTAANENDIISCMRPNMINGTDDDVLNYILRDVNSAYTLNQNNPEPLDLSIDYEDCFLEASSKAGKSVIFDNNGYVEIKGESADYSMSMTFNNDYPTDWFTIKVSGIGANTASIEKDNNGWIFSSDNLKNVEVRTNNKEVSAFTRFSTNYPSALIYEIDKNTIGIKVDTDNNGTYETILNTAVLPKITATSGDSSVTLKWTAVPGAERYGIAGYVNGKWQNLAECSSTYYTLNDLKAGTNYKVAVIAKVNGTWNKDYTNAITVTPKPSPNKYPIVTSEVSGRQFRLKWTAVSGAEKYGIAVYQSGGWRVKVQLNGNTTTYTSPKMKSGTYKMVVCAKINGSWDTSNIKSRAFIVTLV